MNYDNVFVKILNNFKVNILIRKTKIMKLRPLKEIAVVLCATGIVGCHSPYEYKSVAVDGFQYKDVNHRELPTDLGVLTLEKAKEIAIKNNPDFHSAEYSMKAAWARYQQSLATYYPRLFMTGGLNSSNTGIAKQNNYTPKMNDSHSYSQSAALNVEYLIFNGLIRKMNKLSAEHSARASEAAYEDAKRLLTKSVELQYNQVRLIKENIRISEADKEFQEKMLKENELKYKAGSVSQSSVLNFRVRVNAADNRLIGDRYDLINARDVLATLLGLTEGALNDNVELSDLSVGKEITLNSVDIYLDTALNNRPDLKQYRESLKAAEYSLYAKYGAFWPVVTANGSVGVNGNTTDYDSSNNTRLRNHYYDYGVNMTWDIYNGGSRRNAVKEAKALVAQNEQILESMWINVVQEVRNAFNTYKQREEQYFILKETEELQRKNRDLVEIEYRAGSAELTRLNEAQRDLVQAETEKISALINVYNAKAQLEAAIASSL